MEKSEYISRIDEKYQPLISEAERKEFEAFQEKDVLKKAYEEDLRKIEEYFYALDNFERLQEVVNNPPTLIQ